MRFCVILEDLHEFVHQFLHAPDTAKEHFSGEVTVIPSSSRSNDNMNIRGLLLLCSKAKNLHTRFSHLRYEGGDKLFTVLDGLFSLGTNQVLLDYIERACSAVRFATKFWIQVEVCFVVKTAHWKNWMELWGGHLAEELWDGIWGLGEVVEFWAAAVQLPVVEGGSRFHIKFLRSEGE